MSGRFGHALKAVVLGALVAGSMLGATAGAAAAHDKDWRRHDHGREWYSPGSDRGYDRGHDREWRGDRHHRRHGREWREPRVIYAPPPVIYQPRPRVMYAPPPVVYAPAPGFGFSVNIR